ncbi:hypothetical protein GE21DRAFT_1145 [Neurospora crassa]|uniref:Uncharacterized protein n=1 Tax=Neurospora crassa (strain ATCC 24698 / 74-OR23-1A / CBS 708.71 / DSM 1257 / FGSC 987) TaxID=367110 RepID=Q7SFY5_NEUCR|nr:hypothetical protein NCU03109 [Neurospora crassa OR74A]EAA35732.1 hypothetical protein NCU03109 [Neurospora crassa OR74A]KHE85959.1 hypothetical protein GE21DRAFT_1145 [Neurospora crassa]|eukprot:XP_964968.1 hypothetical protein NCU03109 [Neurospora crassa OR74A]
MAYSKYSSDRAPGREHIPLYPKGFIAIRIIQLIIAILIAGLSAFGVHIFAFDGDVLILAVAGITLISSTYHLITRFSTPKAYNYWAVLAVDILVLVLWLASFALLASEIIWFFTLWTSSSESIPTVDPYYDDFTPDEDSYDPYTYGILAALKGAVGNKARASGGVDVKYGDGGYDESAVVATLIAPTCVIAAAALGGIEFILHLISLIIHSVFLHRHRAAGLHSKPVQSSPSSNSNSDSDNSNTILFSPHAVPAPATIVTTPNEKLPYHHQEIDSTPISVPSNHNHRQNQKQQPSAPAPAYTPVSSQQHQRQQQPYLQQQQRHHQMQSQAYQQPQGQAQEQPSVYSYSPVSPQTTGGTNYHTQFQQQPWGVSPVPTTPPVPTHYGPTGVVRAGIYQLP